jgi:hypothetical protein
MTREVLRLSDKRIWLEYSFGNMIELRLNDKVELSD